jgi:hypothetical protein
VDAEGTTVADGAMAIGTVEAAETVVAADAVDATSLYQNQDKEGVGR